MYKETALSRARAALQHNPLLLLMCALSVLVHKTAVTTAAPIAGSFPYRCVKYQTDSALTAQLVAFASALFVLFRFTDPQVHSRDTQYGQGDRGERGFEDFFRTHECGPRWLR